MKWNKKKAEGKELTHAQMADILGSDYVANKKIEKSALGTSKSLGDAIKELAGAKGEVVKKMRLVKGEKFAVGFYTKMIGASIDTEKAEKLIKPDILAKCVVRFLDVDKVAYHVERGDISPKVFKKIAHLGKPSKCTVVMTTEKLRKELEKDEEAENENPS